LCPPTFDNVSSTLYSYNSYNLNHPLREVTRDGQGGTCFCRMRGCVR
jgi:hypothetical protein